jgi:YVTN family beta-propeller protein
LVVFVAFGIQSSRTAGTLATSRHSCIQSRSVYTADQTSNTVSVIDPSSNRLLGVIKLGESVPGAVSRLLPYVERLHLAGRVRAFQDSYGAR